MSSAHLPHTRTCGLAGGYGHSEFISEAISYIKTSAQVLCEYLFPFSIVPALGDRVSFSVME